MKRKKFLPFLLAAAIFVSSIPVYAEPIDSVVTEITPLSAEREITSDIDEERSAELLPSMTNSNVITYAAKANVLYESEPNDYLDDANPVKDNDTYYGEVTDEDIDCYEFSITVDSYIDIYLLADVYGCVAGLYDYDGNLIQEFDYAGTDSDGFHVNTLETKLPANNSSNKYYYIGVALDTDFDSYSGYGFSTLISPFLDVYSLDYFYDPVIWAVENKITTGAKEGYFEPNSTCTRGQVVTFLWRAAGSPTPKNSINPFTDVSPSDYYYNAVLWAVEKDITTGVSKYKFGPNESCTRGQVVTFLHRAALNEEPEVARNPFYDVTAADYYFEPVLWAVDNGITTGTSEKFYSPDDTCTRGQIVTFLYRGYDAIDWNALAAYISSKPVTPPPTHSDFYIEGVTVDEVITYFKEVALDSEFNATESSKLVQKWTGPISYYIHGNPTAKDLEVLNSFVAWLNTIPGFPGMSETTNEYAAVLNIHFCTYNELLDIMGNDFVNCDGAVTYWYYENEIYNGTICYCNDIDQYVRNSVILEEIYNGLGLVQDTYLRPDSIAYQYYSTPQKLTTVDELLLKLLYHPDMKCGMNEQQVEQVIRSLYF